MPSDSTRRMMHGLNFETDAAVSDPHAIFSVRGGRLFVKALPTPGGVYLCIRGERAIEPGALFSIAGHHLRYLGEIPTRSENKLYGAAPRKGLIGVEELYADGFRGCRVVRPAPKIIIGRSNCDMTFPDDRQVSERHAELTWLILAAPYSRPTLKPVCPPDEGVSKLNPESATPS